MQTVAQGIRNDWAPFLESELQKPYARSLQAFLEEEMANHDVCPTPGDWFRAFRETAVADVNVVIIGQDPYFNGEAMGLSFSVKEGYKLTPSVRNILKEVTGENDVSPYTGNLEGWATQGVFLLNTCLTTRRGEAGAHSKQGWETFSDSVIAHLNGQNRPIVYLAWGKWAHKVTEKVDNPQHHVIKTSHPSPLGATKAGKDFSAFKGSACFNMANDKLTAKGLAPIDWTGTLQRKNESLF
ncbi:uracil-DNA glycosylase [Marinobacter shengliensis]|uniref:uracil-DNA glycosylase n=1 Tax=Marinobacter shengliensis TaxID=1389223 RepID=UPI0011085115|nr:uracil-DNA glycosylase [Marinobacter shengliensis]